MNANFNDIYGSVEKLAKTNAEQAAVAQARIADVVRDGYRMVSEGLTFSVNHTAEIVGKAGKCRTPQELAALHKEWLEGVAARLVEDAKGFLSLSTRLMGETAPVSAVVATSVPVAAPKAAPAVADLAPVVEAPVVVAASVEVVPEEAPVVEPPVVEPVKAESAPSVEAAAPVIEAPVAEAPVVEAADVETPAVETKVPEPVVQAPKAVAKAPSRSARRGNRAGAPAV